MYVTRQVRIGLTLLFAALFVVIAFTYIAGASLWATRSASSRTTESRKPITDAPTDHPRTNPNVRVTVVHTPEVAPSNRIFADRIHSLPMQKKSRTEAIATHIKVQPGDSLWSIATSHNTTVETLKSANHLASDTLQIGQALNVPSTTAKPTIPVTAPASTENTLHYTIQSGDTLWSISLAYGVSINALEADNHLSSGAPLHIGQQLIIHAPTANYTPSKSSQALIQEAPSNLLPVYQAAGKKYDIPWTVLAAIHKEETDFDCTGQDVSSAGAIGPMQFMPSTFAIFGVPAPGHQTADIHNVYDAIYSTAHMLEATGFSRDPYHAIYEYNHSVSYVRDILRMSAV